MDMNIILHFALSIYGVFTIADIAIAYKDKRHYEIKYVGKPYRQHKFLPLLLNNQKWSILAILAVIPIIALINLALG